MIASLAVEGLALVRGGRWLFADLSFKLSAGEAAVLSGPNGAGKTSLLRAVAGLLRPAEGEVTFAGAEGALEADVARERGLHVLGHHDGLKTGRTAREELGFWTRWLGGSDAAQAEAETAFELAPLLPLEVRRLSAGQRRRLSLARLLAAPRPLWLLDEPLAPLDARRRAAFGEVLARHLDGGGLVLAAAHDPLPVKARVIELTPFSIHALALPLEGGGLGGGVGRRSPGLQGDVSPSHPGPSAHTPSPGLSPLEGERSTSEGEGRAP